MAKKRKATKRSTSGRKPKRSARSAMSVATNARKTVKERVAALAEAPLAVCENDDYLQATLNVLRDPNEPIKVRLAALQSLQAAATTLRLYARSRKIRIRSSVNECSALSRARRTATRRRNFSKACSTPKKP
jgi:hypothetical protein